MSARGESYLIPTARTAFSLHRGREAAPIHALIPGNRGTIQSSCSPTGVGSPQQPPPPSLLPFSSFVGSGFFFFFNVFFLNPGGDRDTPSSHLCLPVPLSKKQQGRAPSSSADLQFPGLPFCSVALGERKRVKEGGRASRREGGSVQTGRRRRRPTGCGKKKPERG